MAVTGSMSCSFSWIWLFVRDGFTWRSDRDSINVSLPQQPHDSFHLSVDLQPYRVMMILLLEFHALFWYMALVSCNFHLFACLPLVAKWSRTLHVTTTMTNTNNPTPHRLYFMRENIYSSIRCIRWGNFLANIHDVYSYITCTCLRTLQNPSL